MSFVLHNGQLVPQHVPLINADNSSFKWGDGLFETMKISDGKILLEDYHFERLKKGLAFLGIEYNDFFFDTTRSEIHLLCRQNNCLQKGRVRLAVYRNGEGNAESIIQATALDPGVDAWNDLGWNVGLFEKVFKPLDELSNLKTCSYLPYTLAARHAREAGLDEAMILNSKNSICDGARTNIFIIQNAIVYTPALTEGCVAGVMRRHIITQLAETAFPVKETSLTVNALADADEVFLSNAIIGIKWVASFRAKSYGKQTVFKLYRQLFQA